MLAVLGHENFTPFCHVTYTMVKARTDEIIVFVREEFAASICAREAARKPIKSSIIEARSARLTACQSMTFIVAQTRMPVNLIRGNHHSCHV